MGARAGVAGREEERLDCLAIIGGVTRVEQIATFYLLMRIIPLPLQTGPCGYCGGRKGADRFVTEGAWAIQLSERDYQSLIDAGWRRLGINFNTR